MNVRLRSWFLGASAAVAVCALAAFAENPKGGRFDPPQPALSFRATYTQQMRPTKEPLASLRGRVVLLTIVETYNSQCAAAAPKISALHEKLGPRGLTLLLLTHDEEAARVASWLQEHGIRAAAANVETTQWEKVQPAYPAPGYPWCFVIDAKGVLHLHDHPMGLDENALAPHLDATTQPPLLPAAFPEAQAHLDAGTWSAARTSLLAAADGGKLSKPDLGWAKGVAAWIEMRRSKTIPEGDALEKQGWHWDAWSVFDDFTRRYEGMPDCDVARAKADAIRASKDAAVVQDLVWGDDLAKARDWLDKGKPTPAKLICERLSRLKNRHADRAKELLATIGAKK